MTFYAGTHQMGIKAIAINLQAHINVKNVTNVEKYK